MMAAVSEVNHHANEGGRTREEMVNGIVMQANENCWIPPASFFLSPFPLCGQSC